MNYSLRTIVAVLLLCALPACGRSGLVLHEISGPTMGTVYSIQYLAPPDTADPAGVRRDAETLLAHLTREFSTYDPTSALSALNRASAGEWLPLSTDATMLIRHALALNRLSNGAFDITVGPLLALWGFGATMREQDRIPTDAEIAASLELVGANQIDLRDSPPALRKRVPAVALDLNALVPGYAADRIAARLDQLGLEHYVVDLGGELRLRGRNPHGKRWAIAIDAPASGAAPLVLLLGDGAVSTSGSYRNFFELQGQRYSHTLDPRTGRPIAHELVAVTVIADSALEADGLSTALLVLGPQAGFALAERENLPALFIMRAGERRATRALRPYLEQRIE